MVGALLKFDNWSKNIFKTLFRNMDISLWNFNFQYWESYGTKSMLSDYNELDHIDSEEAKKELMNDDCEVYPEFLELFISVDGTKNVNVKTYEEFINSNNFLSLIIIDHRNIEICSKDHKILNEVISNFNESNLDNKRVVKLDDIPSDAILCAYRSRKDKNIYDKK